MALKIVFNKTRKQTTKTEKPNENENARKNTQMQMQMQQQQSRRSFEFALLVNSFYKQACFLPSILFYYFFFCDGNQRLIMCENFAWDLCCTCSAVFQFFCCKFSLVGCFRL